MRFGDWLDQELKRRDLTPSDFGRRIGRDQSIVSRWVRNETVPRHDGCYQIADEFGIKPEIPLQLAGYLRVMVQHDEAVNLQREALRHELDWLEGMLGEVATRLRAQRSILDGVQESLQEASPVDAEDGARGTGPASLRSRREASRQQLAMAR